MMKGIDSIAQVIWKPIIGKLLSLLTESYSDDLLSVVLFGSVARGTANKESDIDLLVVSSSFPSSMHFRMKELTPIIMKLERSEEFLELRRQGYVSWIQFHPLRPDEAKKTRPIYLDMIEDGVILLDRNSFIEKVLLSVKAKLNRLGAKRIVLGDNSWYWDLKPDIRKGEIIDI